jgi:hypothetical protein
MIRRDALATIGVATLPALLGSVGRADDLPVFWKSRLSDVEDELQRVGKGEAKGETRVLVRSAGGRPIHLVTYGPAEDRIGKANYNSACGGRDPAAFARKDGRQRPVVLFLGPVHGAELEGIVGLVNLLRVAETGADCRGRAWPRLAHDLSECRVLIVPCANPDGRARCSFASWVGEDLATNERVGMGTKPDGVNYTWPKVKQIHPMRGPEVGTLGAYFNDDGINLMHDEWFDPMAPETRAFFRLVRAEAPDFVVSLHSHASNPTLEPTAYVPRMTKEVIQQFGERLRERYADAGLPRLGIPEPREDGFTFPPPSFNLSSALHHACGGVSFVHECCVGVKTAPYPLVTHDQILDIQMLLYQELLRFALEHRVSWMSPSS